MKIVLLGGSGYIARHVIKYLTGEHDVTVFDKYIPELPSDNVRYEIGNILDKKSVFNVLNGQDIVFNFVAMPSIEECNSHIYEAVELNVLGNINVLDGCVENNIKRYIYASSVYALSKYGGVYGITKRLTEELVLHYHKTQGVEFTVLRYGTIYGPEEGQGNSLYLLIKQAIEENAIYYQGDGNELREYIHIEDVGRLTAKSILEEYKNEFFMITGLHPYKISDVLELIEEILDRKIEIKYMANKKKYHYSKTPANYREIIAKKMLNRSYIDMHQGLLNCINRISATTKVL